MKISKPNKHQTHSWEDGALIRSYQLEAEPCLIITRGRIQIGKSARWFCQMCASANIFRWKL